MDGVVIGIEVEQNGREVMGLDGPTCPHKSDAKIFSREQNIQITTRTGEVFQRAEDEKDECRHGGVTLTEAD